MSWINRIRSDVEHPVTGPMRSHILVDLQLFTFQRVAPRGVGEASSPAGAGLGRYFSPRPLSVKPALKKSLHVDSLSTRRPDLRSPQLLPPSDLKPLSIMALR